MSNPTRETILRTLRARGKCTVNELAEAAGVSPVSVRHHLSNLQAEDLISTEVMRHGVGRPRLLFSLTERAHELLPSRYFQLTHRLLGEMKDHLPEETFNELISGVASGMAQDYADRLAGLPLERRLALLVEFLSKEGFEAEVEARGDRMLIHELSCPYFRMGREHPEICRVDQTFIAASLSLPVERVTCLLEGHPHCTFSVGRDLTLEEASFHG
jgi:DeoR family suf operon transcriptional repressor